MNERYKSIICSDLLLINNDKVLLMKRKSDNIYELPGGHLENDEDVMEAVIRETEEEIGISLQRKDIKLVQLIHHYKENRINFIFLSKENGNKAKIMEPNKCLEIIWANINNLPDNIDQKVKKIMNNFINDINYDTYCN